MKIIALFCAASLAGQPKPKPAPIQCVPDQPTRCNVEIKAGEPARFDGQLFTPDLAIALGQAADSAEARINAAVTATIAAQTALRTRDAKIWEAELDVVKKQRDVYKQANSRPLIEHPIVVSSLTAVVIVTLFFGAVAVVKEADD